MTLEPCRPDFVLKPAFRKLRAYAFDPSLSLRLDTAVINNLTYQVPWEEVTPGPVGEYIEVVDYDPSSGCFYLPVDLNNRYLLAQDGLDPSESNPQFHQQMVYAVAMTTIKNFESALGRKIMWSPYRDRNGYDSSYVQRLRIYPHALREANAYYSPQKKALLFGYFNASPDSPDLLMPGSNVFTCLSHDIIAHEITHALLDGMHRRYVEPTHRDSLAFHEAFADIVALFQHFTFPEVLIDQIRKTRGDLSAQNLLGALAHEFGKAIGHYGSLRDAIGRVNPETKKWEQLVPNPEDYKTIDEPHARGAILVATIFDIFLKIYKDRVADLIRIGTGGSGELPPGALHPDLVNRMAKEASKSASHVLQMCIRALDYCPPMDISFGDYLRALITADYDLVEDDRRDYRIAMIEAFQKRGIYPENVKSMSVESLLCKADEDGSNFEEKFDILIDFFKLFKEKLSYINNREKIYELTKNFIAGGPVEFVSEGAGRIKSKTSGRPETVMGLHQRLNVKFMGNKDAAAFEKITGLILDESKSTQLGISLSEARNTQGRPTLEVHNLKLVNRVGPTGTLINQILVTLTQRRGVVCESDSFGNTKVIGFFNPKDPHSGFFKRIPREDDSGTFSYKHMPHPGKSTGSTGEGSEMVLPPGWFEFRGGCTLIFDLNYASSRENLRLKYVIKKDINDEERMKRQYNLLFNRNDFSLNATYFGTAYGNLEAEPFAMIHKVL